MDLQSPSSDTDSDNSIIFDFYCAASVVLFVILVLSIFSKWSFRGRPDRLMIFVLPVNILFLMIYAVIFCVQLKMSDSEPDSAPSWVDSVSFVFNALMTMSLLITIPRLIARQIQKAELDKSLHVLKHIAICAWVFFFGLQFSNLGLQISLENCIRALISRGYDETTYATYQTLAYVSSKLMFAGTVLYIVYIFVLFSLSAPLFRRLKDGEANVFILCVILPLLLVKYVTLSAYVGMNLTHEHGSALFGIAYPIINIVTLTIILLVVTSIGVIRRVKAHKAHSTLTNHPITRGDGEYMSNIPNWVHQEQPHLVTKLDSSSGATPLPMLVQQNQLKELHANDSHWTYVPEMPTTQQHPYELGDSR